MKVNIENLHKMSEAELQEMYHSNLELWERADREGKVNLAEYFDDRLNDIEVVWLSRDGELEELQ